MTRNLCGEGKIQLTSRYLYNIIEFALLGLELTFRVILNRWIGSDQEINFEIWSQIPTLAQ